MSAAKYASFLKAIGHRVVRTESNWWFDVGPGIYMNFPYAPPIEPGPAELDRLLRWRGLAARYACPPDQGVVSSMVVCRDKDYNFGSLSTKTRNQTRRGLEKCAVQRLSFLDLESLGVMDLIRDTKEKHGQDFQTTAYWRNYLAAAEATDTMEAWIATLDGKLASRVGAQG